MSERPTPLYVRIATDSARLIDEAVNALGVTKRQVVEDAVRHHLGATDDLVVGHASVREPMPDVLTAGEAAALLKVGELEVLEAAERGDLPGRKLGTEWRFAREALITWLGAPAAQG